MEFVLFLFFIILLVMLIVVKNSVATQSQILQQKIDALSDELKRVKTREGALPAKEESMEPKKSVLSDILLQHSKPPETPQPFKPADTEKPKVVERSPEPILPDKKVPSKEESVVTFGSVITPPEAVEPEVVQPKKPGFFERNPDLEKFIGENLANKIGIGVLVLGIGFFVKYAIDQNWINEIGRVFIGIACGGILIGVAHYLRKTFTAFSSVLVGGGIAILYLTIAIAFHEYALFTQTAAFILMLVITAFTIVLSLGYNRIELAVLSLLGGFAAPFMVSTGDGNYVVLFSYILILDSGMLVLAYYKKWNLVNIIAFVLTLLLFASWLGVKFDGENLAMVRGAIVFATLFYLVFFLMNIVNNIRQRTAFKGLEIGLLLSNTFLYYAAGMVILSNNHTDGLKGLFTAALGVFNFGFAFALYRNQRVDRNLVFLLIGLVLTFISLAAPIQLEGNYITLFWSCEAVLLLWLSQKSGIRLMKLASIVVMVLMLFSLAMDWEQIYFLETTTPLNIILNKGYITGLFALASVVLTFVLLKNEAQGAYANYVVPYRVVLTIAGIALLYTTQFLELQYQLYEYFGADTETQNVIIGVYNMSYILLLLLLVDKLAIPREAARLFPALGIVAMLAYLFFYHYQIILVRNKYLYGEIAVTGFAIHYVLVAVLLAVSVITLIRIRTFTEFNAKIYNAYAWLFVFFYLVVASAELDHTVMMIGFTDTESMFHLISQNHKIGFPILWGIASFILIALGFRKKMKHLRIISLTLFLITLLKLFLVDIKGISEGGKIAAFISLGVLLLIVSFMYQRLKKLLLEDEAVAAQPIDSQNEPPKP